MTRARKQHEEALALRTQIAEVETAAKSRLALSELFIDDGRLSEAEADAKEAADEFRGKRRPTSKPGRHADVLDEALRSVLKSLE